MGSLETLGFLLGTSFASGLNLYATIATLGLLSRTGLVRLPPPLDPLRSPAVLGIAAFLYIVEFFADKIPWVDSLWDLLHTFIRPPAAAVLAYAAVGGVPDEWRIAAALLAGTVALTSHGVKASTRAAANLSPEPFSNWLLSATEDALAIFLAWMAAKHPVLTTAITVALSVVAAYVIIKLFGRLRQMVRRVLAGQPGPSSATRT